MLVIIADDQGVDKVGAWADDVAGYRDAAATLPSTPNIDAIAHSGMRFSTAWSNPTCSPTRAALLTGTHGYRSGVTETVDRVGDLDVTTSTTLPTVLGDGGDGDAYTSGLFGKWHLGFSGDPEGTSWDLDAADGGYLALDATPHPLLAGFDAYAGGLGGILHTYWDWPRVSSYAPGFTEVEAMTTYATDQVVEDALAWIDDQAGPWFAVVAFNAPHTSDATNSYDPNDVKPGCHTVTCVDDGSCADESRFVYRALVECMDTAIGDLLDGLPSDEVDDTIVVFLGDNGTTNGLEEGDFQSTGTRSANGKGTVYESGVRVPLAVAQGRNWREWQACTEAERETGACALTEDRFAAPGRVVESRVQVLDVFATITDLAGHSSPMAVDSVSFADCLTATGEPCGGDAVDPDRVLYTEMYEADDEGIAAAAAAVWKGDWKLAARWNTSNACMNYELFELTTDRFEEHNRSVSQPARLATMKATLAGLGVPWYGSPTACVVGGPNDKDLDGYIAESAGGDDCNDSNAAVNPGAEERWYDGQDRDCDGADDYDKDGDGHRHASYGGDDCVDTSEDIHPGAEELWYDGIDQDCDGNDTDQDYDGFEALGYGGEDPDDTDPSVVPDGVDAAPCEGCTTLLPGTDEDGDGYVAIGDGGDDCDDLDPEVYPGAVEAWYDGVDQDCDGNDDDQDGDGVVAIEAGGEDCDDLDAATFPGATEAWYDGIDQDCDGNDDDRDGDGVVAIEAGGDDCDDTDPEVYVGAAEVWYDGVDQDCDGNDDDRDRDGYPAVEAGGTDCNDGVASINPGAREAWYDGVDRDCSGGSDYDRDGDGHDAAAYGGDDCDDFSAAVYPGAFERYYDGEDGNCDGRSDYDADGDGYDAAAYGGTDCDDTKARVNPAAFEVRGDGRDSNCNGADDT